MHVAKKYGEIYLSQTEIFGIILLKGYLAG